MAAQMNFLIGRGELLTSDIKPPKRGGTKAEVYTLEESKRRLIPEIEAAANYLDTLPSDVFPGDMAITKVTLNPSYIAKSYFPSAFFRTSNLFAVGSRTVANKPAKWSKKVPPIECTTTELFIAGKRSSIRDLPRLSSELLQGTPEAIDFARIEKFSVFAPEEKIRHHTQETYYEIGLHLIPDAHEFVQQSFVEFARKLDIQVFVDLQFTAGNLWFLPLETHSENLEVLANYSFVRVIRPVPKLRGFRPLTRTVDLGLGCSLPSGSALSNEPTVAILDGGLPDGHPLSPWIRNYYKLDSAADDVAFGTDHGLAVSSAVLFGPITPGSTASQPYSPIDHVRVLDAKSETEDPLELYRTLGHIEEVLLSRQYQFINLSLGPDLPIEDTDVHAWTSVIDDLLSDGNTFMTIAVGNNGEQDRSSGNSRIQVPSDSVNALAVGAADKSSNDWKRATYSAIGPGRMPGIIKPDLMAFGGSPAEYFHALTVDATPKLIPNLGTSFAAPNLLRMAVGVRAILGPALSPLTIKALLVHAADRSLHDKVEVGWGKVPEDILDIIGCPPGVARIVYQGELKPGKYIRANLPLPKSGLSGMVKLKATFCYSSPTDPQDASAYTKAGLEIVFRPNIENKDEDAQNAASKGFFDMKEYASEIERRYDSGKWETTLHGKKTMRASSLNGPTFDIHYNAREGAGVARVPEKIKYALVITIEADKHQDLYNDILQSYPSILVAIQPQINVPVKV
jgi:hypothetical protein